MLESPLVRVSQCFLCAWLANSRLQYKAYSDMTASKGLPPPCRGTSPGETWTNVFSPEIGSLNRSVGDPRVSLSVTLPN